MRKKLIKHYLVITLGALTVLVFGNSVEAAPSVSDITVTDVTAKSFSVVWASSEPSKPDLRVYDDPDGRVPTTGIILTPQPIVSGPAEIAVQAEDNGVMKVRVTGLSPERSYYFKTITTSKETGDITTYPDSLPPLLVSTETRAMRERVSGDVRFPLANDLLINELYLEDGKTPSYGSLVVLSVEGASSPLSSFVGDGVDPPFTVIDLNNAFDFSDRKNLNILGGEVFTLYNQRGVLGQEKLLCKVPPNSNLIQALSPTCKTLPVGQPVDLCNWTVVQYEFDKQSDANWLFDDTCTAVTQDINADASILLGNFDITQQVIEGTIEVNTDSDDDFIGFVFAYQGRGNYYLFDWRQTDQNDDGRLAERGMTLKRVNMENGEAPTETDLRFTKYSSNVTILKHNTIIWKDFTKYTFRLEFHAGSFTIMISEGPTILEYWALDDNTYSSGLFGLYNLSQKSVVYADITQANTTVWEDFGWLGE